MSKKKPLALEFGTMHSTREVGEILRAFRKKKHTTLEKISGLTNVSIRFLSELERGKETAEIGKATSTMQ